MNVILNIKAHTQETGGYFPEGGGFDLFDMFGCFGDGHALVVVRGCVWQNCPGDSQLSRGKGVG